MSRFRSTKRAKEISRKARHQAKEERTRERREKAQSGEADDDIDWSQAVGFAPPPEESVGEESEARDDTEWGEVEESLVVVGRLEGNGEGAPGRER